MLREGEFVFSVKAVGLDDSAGFSNTPHLDNSRAALISTPGTDSTPIARRLPTGSQSLQKRERKRCSGQLTPSILRYSRFTSARKYR